MRIRAIILGNVDICQHMEIFISCQHREFLEFISLFGQHIDMLAHEFDSFRRCGNILEIHATIKLCFAIIGVDDTSILSIDGESVP